MLKWCKKIGIQIFDKWLISLDHVTYSPISWLTYYSYSTHSDQTWNALVGWLCLPETSISYGWEGMPPPARRSNSHPPVYWSCPGSRLHIASDDYTTSAVMRNVYQNITSEWNETFQFKLNVFNYYFHIVANWQFDNLLWYTPWPGSLSLSLWGYYMLDCS